MKALEMLKKYSCYIKLSLAHNREYLVDEAISELEELMKPKSCEGCIDNNKDTDFACEDCSRSYNDRYEPLNATI